MPKGVYERTPEMNAANSKAHTGVPLSPEHCAAMSEASINSDAVKAHNESMRGVPLSPEHIAAIRESDATKAAAEAQRGVPKSPEYIASLENHWKKMRGGNDICDHHVAYDFLRPKALIVRITRSFHGQIHHPKGCKFGTYGYSLID